MHLQFPILASNLSFIPRQASFVTSLARALVSFSEARRGRHSESEVAADWLTDEMKVCLNLRVLAQVGHEACWATKHVPTLHGIGYMHRI